MTIQRTLFVGVALAGAASAGCYGNDASAFPAGLGPWEEHTALPPAPVDGDVCPEVISFGENYTFMGMAPNGSAYRANAVQATGCIHQPMSVVWDAIRDPQVGKDHTSVNTFMVIDPPMASECDGLYQSQINAGPAPFTVDFRLCWRMQVAEGLEDAPTLTATRWQKVWGSSALSVMEGSLVARPHEDDPTITVVEYQYHLNAISSTHETIRNYLTVIYGRLLDRTYDRTLP
jgi:hypothetical protein